MILNSPALILKAINGYFAKSLLEQETTKDDLKRVAEVVKSENGAEEYVFFESMPTVNEFLDRIEYEKFKAFYLNIQNREWQYGVPVKRTTIEDTITNGLQPQIQKFIQEGIRSWSDFPFQLINDLISANGTAFDGTNFFANSRPNIEGANTINNIVGGTGIDLDDIQTDFLSAIERMMGFKAKNGRPYNRNAKFLALIPAQLYSKFLTLQNNDFIAIGGATANNPLKGLFEIQVNYDQDITANDWYLINSNAVVKPFIYQIRKEPIFDIVDNADEPYVKFFSTARLNAGYGNPMAIVMINN